MKSAESYLSEQVERLMALPLETKSDLEKWIAESDKVSRALGEEFPDFEPSDNYWHFIADPDIRLRDKGYGDRQHKLMLAYVSRLRSQPSN